MNVVSSFPTRALVLELNELCPPLMDKFMAEGMLPNFKRLHDRSEVYTTTTEDESLEPWVQWVSYHSGQPQSVHGIEQLDEGDQLDMPAIWDRLADAGRDTLVFGVMNAAPAASKHITLMPDPWSSRVRPSKPDYEVFHRFVSAKVAGHTNPNAKSGLGEVMSFVRFLFGHGIKASTLWKGVSQILSEKTSGARDLKWRRATVLDFMAFDVFAHEYKKLKPDVAFFFGNSVAFYQHRYWRHMDPSAYAVKPSEAEMASYGDAIRHGYREMDKLVGEAMELAGDDTAIIFVTALSQQANLAYEDIGGKFVYRPRDFDAMMDWLGAPKGWEIQPVMTHQAWASYPTEEEAEACLKAMQSVTANGKPVFMAWREEARVFFCCDFIQKVEDDLAMVKGGANETTPFAEHFALVGQVNNSKHHPDGCFWVRRPGGTHRRHEEKIPLESAAFHTLDAVGAQQQVEAAE